MATAPHPSDPARLNLAVSRALRAELKVLAARREITMRALVRDVLAQYARAATADRDDPERPR